MSTWLAAEIILGWFLGAIVLAVLIGAAMGWDENTEPLLCRWADRRDQRRMVKVILTREREETEWLRHADYSRRLHSLATEAELERLWRSPARDPRR